MEPRVACEPEVHLVHGPVALSAFSAFPPGAGGECIFVGRTRDEIHPEHGRLIRLEYEAFEPMAKSVLDAIAREATDRCGCLAVRVHHSLGPVPTGEASVVVQVACAHRAEAFEACRLIIDRLKKEAPIWKKEIFAGGSSWSSGSAVNVTGDGVVATREEQAP